MPPLPTITDVFRCTFNWTLFDGVAPKNVIHVRAPSATEEQVAIEVLAALQTHQFEGMPEDFVLDTLDVLPLDGATATFSAPGDGYNSGGGSGDFSPASAAVVSLRTAQRGARGRGRVYVGPLQESVMTDGHFNSGNVTELGTAWVDFRQALIDSAITAHLCVASYVHADSHDVASIAVDSILGTQRRRQDQLR